MTRRVASVAVVVLLGVAGPAVAAFTGEARNAGNRAEAAAVFAPRSVTPPTITGASREGETLTGHVGDWSRDPHEFALQWLRCGATGEGCTEIEAATTATHELVEADLDRTLRFRVTARNSGGASTTTSQATGPVRRAADVPPPLVVTAPSVSGPARVDGLLSVSAGAWAGSPTRFEFRWQRCPAGQPCVEIAGATGSQYRVRPEDLTATLRAAVTAFNDGGASAPSTTSPTAAVARRTYIHVICANPDTGQGVIADGELPEGLTQANPSGTPSQFSALAARARCAGPMTLSRGIAIRPSAAIASTPAWNGRGGWLQYRPPPGIAYHGGSLHRRVSWAGGAKLTSALHFSPTSFSPFVTPFYERCSQVSGCTGLAAGATAPFTGTAVTLGASGGAGFGWTLGVQCEGDAAGSCTAGTGSGLTLFGAKASLSDTAGPTVTAPRGRLVEDATLDGAVEVTFGADDAGTGLYRARVRLDEVDVAAEPMGSNGGRCADVNPANANDYEFAYQLPCASRFDGTLTFDASSWPAGQHRLHVSVEDAGGNPATVVERDVTVGG